MRTILLHGCLELKNGIWRRGASGINDNHACFSYGTGLVENQINKIRMNNEQDPSDFRRMILESPGQFSEGMKLAGAVRFSSHPDLRSLMISGMGGSALPGNIFRIYLSDLVRRGLLSEPVSIYQNRFYELPWEARRSLNVFASYSGNT